MFSLTGEVATSQSSRTESQLLLPIILDIFLSVTNLYGISIRHKKLCLALFADDIIIFTSNPRADMPHIQDIFTSSPFELAQAYTLTFPKVRFIFIIYLVCFYFQVSTQTKLFSKYEDGTARGLTVIMFDQTASSYFYLFFNLKCVKVLQYYIKMQRQCCKREYN